MSYRDDLEGLAHRTEALEKEANRKARELTEAKRLLEQARTRAKLPVLDNLHIAAPCKADWAKMIGDERARYCNECDKNVYNLSSMTRAAAEALLIEKEGKLCVRYYQRADGTILTADCPDGLARRRRRNKVIAISFGAMSAVAAAATALFPRAPLMGAPRPSDSMPMGAIAVPVQEMGDVAAPRNVGIPVDHYTEVKGGPRRLMGKPKAPEKPTPPPERELMGKVAISPKMGGLAVTK